MKCPKCGTEPHTPIQIKRASRHIHKFFSQEYFVTVGFNVLCYNVIVIQGLTLKFCPEVISNKFSFGLAECFTFKGVTHAILAIQFLLGKYKCN